MENQRERLTQELQELDEQITTLKQALSVKPEYGMGKGDPAITQWELDQAMLERLERHADTLRKAISRFDEGSYGICERCGKRINPERLAVLPDTTLCMACAQKG